MAKASQTGLVWSSYEFENLRAMSAAPATERALSSSYPLDIDNQCKLGKLQLINKYVASNRNCVSRLAKSKIQARVEHNSGRVREREEKDAEQNCNNKNITTQQHRVGLFCWPKNRYSSNINHELWSTRTSIILWFFETPSEHKNLIKNYTKNISVFFFSEKEWKKLFSHSSSEANVCVKYNRLYIWIHASIAIMIPWENTKSSPLKHIFVVLIYKQ